MVYFSLEKSGQNRKKESLKVKFIFEGLGWLFDIEPARSSKCHECDKPLVHQGFWSRLLWPERRLKHTCLGCYKFYPQIVEEDEDFFEDGEDE